MTKPPPPRCLLGEDSEQLHIAELFARNVTFLAGETLRQELFDNDTKMREMGFDDAKCADIAVLLLTLALSMFRPLIMHKCFSQLSLEQKMMALEELNRKERIMLANKSFFDDV